MTRSAPSANGRWIRGDQVLSTGEAGPGRRAQFRPTAARSVNFKVGLEGVSAQTIFVFLRTAFLSAIQIRHIDEIDRELPAAE